MTKKLIIGFVGIVLISLSLAPFFLRKIMNVPANVVNVGNKPSTVPIVWEPNETSDRSALLVPIGIEGIEESLYMQLDLGAQTSMLYNTPMDGLRERYPGILPPKDRYLKQLQYSIGGTTFTYDSIANLRYGNMYNRGQKNIVGTIGTDILEHVGVLIDFNASKISFFKNIPDSIQAIPKNSFEFDQRRIHLPAEIEGQKRKLMWDTGSSAYELITSKDDFNDLAVDPSSFTKHAGNQMDRKLEVFTTPSNKIISFGDVRLKLNNVTYVEGFPWYIHLAFYLSGMEGMVGNNLFRNHALFLDTKNREFAIL